MNYKVKVNTVVSNDILDELRTVLTDFSQQHKILIEVQGEEAPEEKTQTGGFYRETVKDVVGETVGVHIEFKP
ncbi:MAG: hypothetical protein AAF378_10585 [Cyanobacteria bacterium P01_A01_bin.84]